MNHLLHATAKAREDWEAFFAISSSMGLGLQVAALDDFSEQAIVALRTARRARRRTRIRRTKRSTARRRTVARTAMSPQTNSRRRTKNTRSEHVPQRRPVIRGDSSLLEGAPVCPGSRTPLDQRIGGAVLRVRRMRSAHRGCLLGGGALAAHTSRLHRCSSRKSASPIGPAICFVYLRTLSVPLVSTRPGRGFVSVFASYLGEGRHSTHWAKDGRASRSQGRGRRLPSSVDA